jgi:hypothetical protein
MFRFVRSVAALAAIFAVQPAFAKPTAATMSDQTQSAAAAHGQAVADDWDGAGGWNRVPNDAADV